MIRKAAVLGWAMLLGVSPAAQECAQAAETAPAPTQIQLRSFMVPVKSANPKGAKELPITVILTLAEGERAFFVCEMTPRLRDSMLGALYNNPIPLSAQNVMDLSQVEPLVLEAINKALQGPLLTGIQMKQGAEEVPKKSSRSRAGAVGCAEIEEQNKRKQSAPH
jgi:hypothetical protein